MGIAAFCVLFRCCIVYLKLFNPFATDLLIVCDFMIQDSHFKSDMDTKLPVNIYISNIDLV